jgi:Ca2+-transporting ATPase
VNAEQKHASWHSLGTEDVLSQQESTHEGLTPDEVARRLESFGPNALPETRRRNLIHLFLRQFQSPLIYILFVAALMAMFLGKHGDALVILAVVIVNSLIGGFQEGRAERSMAALKRFALTRVRVLRGDEELEITARELVPGDMLILTAGDAVGADARIIEAAGLETGEAALTGESLPIAKQSEPLPDDVLLADRSNMLYSGTHITAGRGKAVVVATGVMTEIGKIARMTAGAEEPSTPLELRIAQFGRYLVAAALIMFVAVLGLGLLRGLPFVDIFMVAISQMVSMVPEGLPVAMTIALAVGMQRMAGRGAIVRRLAAVETLGSTSIICTDKTGTLTRNEMTVTEIHLRNGRLIEVTGVGYSPQGALQENGKPVKQDADLQTLLEAAALCNDAKLVAPDEEDNRWRALGDPTEAALLTLAKKGGISLEALDRNWVRWGEIPFDSNAKMMATGLGNSQGDRRILIKGAPEAVLSLCVSEQIEVPAASTDASAQDMLSVANALADRALRVLAVAEVSESELDDTRSFDQFRGKARLLGLVAQIDPPRSEVKDAVTACRDAGIRPVMVTGDHKATGLAIARALGIARDGDRALDGHELERMPEQDLQNELDHIAVFARVYPAQKLRIVEAFQSQRNVVAMTGDGVNDAPALARADIGVAMGITGTEVAKQASKIIITDDNFATIVHAVEEGRLVYRNLKKVILYLFATSMAEIAVLMSALLLGYPLPLAAVQILWINIVTEGTVTVNLIMDPPEGDEMRRRPMSLAEPLLTRSLLKRALLMTPVMAASTFGYFIWRLSTDVPFEQVQTETFTVLAACQWFNVLNCQSEIQSVFGKRLFRNKWLIGGLSIGVLLQIAVIYSDVMNRLFHTVPVPPADILPILAVASSVLWAEELRKLFVRLLTNAAGVHDTGH